MSRTSAGDSKGNGGPWDGNEKCADCGGQLVKGKCPKCKIEETTG